MTLSFPPSKSLLLSILSLGLAASLAACGGGGGGGGENASPAGGDGSSSQGWNQLLGTAGATTAGDHVALDPSGNVFIAGTSDGDLDGTFGGSGQHAYLAKYNADGSLLFLNKVPTVAAPEAVLVGALATDRDGNAHVINSTWVDRDEQLRPALLQYSPEGELLGELDLGVDGAVVVMEGLAVDAEGNRIVAGWTYDFDGSFYEEGTSVATAGYVVAKYDPDGNQLWRKVYHSLNEHGYPAGSYAFDLAVDGYGNIYVTGATRGSLHGQTPVGGYVDGTRYLDSFLVKFDPNGNIVYSRQFGAYRQMTRARAIAVDESGRIFVVGDITGNFPGENRYGHTDYFLGYFGNSGNLQDIQQLGAPGGGSTMTQAHGVATDPAGNVYVAGATTGSIDGVPEVGITDAFVSKYDSSLYRVATQQLGVSNGHGYYNDIAVDQSGTVYTAGYVRGDSFEGSSIKGQIDAVLGKHNGDWSQKTADPATDDGSGSGDGSGGTLDWKESWKFVQGDKAVQYRLALVRVDGSHHIFRIQYRVNSSDGIYTSASNGYHLYQLDDQSFKYRVEFPASFHGLSMIYQLPVEIAVYVDGSNVEWDSTSNKLIYHNSAYGPSGYSSCVDDNSAASRCEGYYQWDRSEISAQYQYTATANQ